MANGNGGTVTKGWLLAILGPLLLAVLVWIAKGLTTDVRAMQGQVENAIPLRLYQHEVRLGRTDTLLMQINRKLDLLLEERPRR